MRNASPVSVHAFVMSSLGDLMLVLSSQPVCVLLGPGADRTVGAGSVLAVRFREGT